MPSRPFGNKNASKPLAARFWAKVDRRGDSECWPWTGSNCGGYGNIWVDGKVKKAYRVGYEMLVGPIPAGLVMDHKCRNPRCVNPAHLEPVTLTENILRGIGPTAQNARKLRCPAGHDYTRQKDGGRTCVTCHVEYQRGRNWFK